MSTTRSETTMSEWNQGLSHYKKKHKHRNEEAFFSLPPSASLTRGARS